MRAGCFDFRTPSGSNSTHGKHHSFDHGEDDFGFVFGHARHHDFQFAFVVNPDAPTGVFDDLGAAGASLDLHGIGNVVIGDMGASTDVSVHGGSGLSTVVLGDGDNDVTLQGAFNTVILGDGNDIVNVGHARASAVFHDGAVHITYGNFFAASFASPLDLHGIHASAGNHLNIGYFNGGTGNIGAFNGLGNSDLSDGNDNIGVFNGNDNGGRNNGNGNIGAFNGNFNGLGNADASDGNGNGNGNIGVLNGNYNGNLNAGHDAGNGNGNGNFGADNGNLNGNGVDPVALHGGMGANACFVGGFNTVVVGNGSDCITALAGISTIVAGNGNDRFVIGGSYNTLVAGDGADHVLGLNVDHTTIALGDGGCTVSLTGAGCNVVTTGSGDDLICLSGFDNWVNAGGATTFNTIFGGAGQDTFAFAPAGSGMDKIFDFSLCNGDRLDLRDVLAATHWDGSFRDLGHVLSTETVGGNTLLQCTTLSGDTATVAELMGTSCTLAMLEAHHSLIV
ncbi:type I secretion C-terminal target domain-containing protein [Bradyrhizobium sp.]|uniref:type I secretion C-terminal target domain-containing protein n=1 Tax=Bradyrhizobium sp. TaxID=376 RepID=UPI0026125059|nr:type I secretion C-terminal target domain-containing protein [Bradyrhizobium sp.]